jgi:hypothetical protein
MPDEIDFEYAGVTKLLSTFDKGQLARLLEVLIVDLDKQPNVCEEELEPLPESLTAEAEEENPKAREAFGPILATELEEMSTTCQIHSKIGRRLLHNLDRYLHREAHHPPAAMADTYHTQIFTLLRGAFDTEISEILGDDCSDAIPYTECAGCRVRRIISDKLFLGSLMVAAHLRPSVFTNVLEAAWYRLGAHVLRLHGTEVARYAFEHRAEATELGADNVILLKGPGFGKPNMIVPFRAR